MGRLRSGWTSVRGDRATDGSQKLAQAPGFTETVRQPQMQPISPPNRVSAEVFHQELHGSHEALLLWARGQTGLVECVVKLSARLGECPTPYLCEWVATTVARALGVHVPDPLAVSIGAPFANSLTDESTRGAARSSLGVAFGSRFMPGYVQWTPTAGVHPEQRDAASLLFAFDVFVHNYDRTEGNPNLLVRREDLLAIDHDLTFEFVYPSSCANPELDPRRDVVDKHAFRVPLKGKLSDLADFRQAVRGLTDEWLATLMSATPPEWMVGHGASVLGRIVDVVKGRRDHVEDWLRQVETWME